MMNAGMQLFKGVDAWIYGSSLTSIAGLTGIDLYTNEDHTQTVTATRLSVESGASITDHASIDPARIVIKGVVSNISSLVGNLFIIGGIGYKNNNKPRQGWSNIETLQLARNPLTVVTSLKVYTNMLITSLSVPEVNVETGTNMYFTLQLDEVQVVGSKVVPFPPNKLGPRGVSKKSNPAGNMTSKVNGGERQSALESISEKVGQWV